MKTLLKIAFIFSCLMNASLFSQEKSHEEAFIKSFKHKDDDEAILMLGSIETPTEFGCGTAAYDFSNQIASFSSGEGESLGNNSDFLRKFQNNVNYRMYWYYLYGSVYYRNKETPKAEINFKNNNDKLTFLENTLRFDIRFQKINRKKVIYHCVFTNIKEQKRTTERYFISKTKTGWLLDKIDVKIIERDYADVYLKDYLKDE